MFSLSSESTKELILKATMRISLSLKVAQLCLTLFNIIDWSPPGSSVHEILARILEWVAISFSRGSSQPSDGTLVSHIAGRFFTIWATREAMRIYLYLKWNHSLIKAKYSQKLLWKKKKKKQKKRREERREDERKTLTGCLILSPF